MGDGHSPSRSRAIMTWPTISAGDRLRTSRCVPVWQNVQFSVQPTWEETQSVPRSSSGMWTVSTSMAVGQADQPLARAVVRRLAHGDVRPLDDEMLGEAGAEILGQRRSSPRKSVAP